MEINIGSIEESDNVEMSLDKDDSVKIGTQYTEEDWDNLVELKNTLDKSYNEALSFALQFASNAIPEGSYVERIAKNQLGDLMVGDRFSANGFEWRVIDELEKSYLVVCFTSPDDND